MKIAACVNDYYSLKDNLSLLEGFDSKGGKYTGFTFLFAYIRIMGKKLNYPHAKFFKSFIYQKDNAIDFLKTFLPKKLADNINFTTLTIENTSFINESLTEAFSDAIFICKMKDYNKKIFISILI